jgi:hypothetical protein
LFVVCCVVLKCRMYCLNKFICVNPKQIPKNIVDMICRKRIWNSFVEMFLCDVIVRLSCEKSGCDGIADSHKVDERKPNFH